MLVGIEGSTTMRKKQGSNKITCENASWGWKHSMTMKALCAYRTVILLKKSRDACSEAMVIYLNHKSQYFNHRETSIFFKYQIHCNKRNALSLFKAWEIAGRLIFGGNSFGISTTSRSLLKNETKSLHEGGSKR
jgi:hypothetical protein